MLHIPHLQRPSIASNELAPINVNASIINRIRKPHLMHLEKLCNLVENHPQTDDTPEIRITSLMYDGRAQPATS
jgi:hypothetical protein